ncbi:MAG: hypothetical protein K5651_04560 [Bacteroidales bacterium]|nr:hypothetical protein [Bacteroidales bacterium]
MMLAGSLQPVAKVLKSNGSDGVLVLGIHSLEVQDFLSLTLQEKVPVFLYFEGLPVPFFIEEAEPRGTSKLLVRMTGIHSGRDAEEVVGAKVYLDASQFEEDADGEDLSQLVGWTLCNRGVPAGVITAFEDIPGNPCLELEGGVLIPLHEELIRSLDEKKKCLDMELPDGLLEK